MLLKFRLRFAHYYVWSRVSQHMLLVCLPILIQSSAYNSGNILVSGQQFMDTMTYGWKTTVYPFVF